jgi:hypothetical protein
MALEAGVEGEQPLAAVVASGLQRRDVDAELRGGQQQRALARIAAARPAVVAAGVPCQRRVVAVHGRAQELEDRPVRRRRVGAHRHGGAVLPQRRRRHPPLGQRAGLVGADDVGGPERLDRRELLDQRTPLGHPPDPDGKRERDGRQQTLGNVGHQQPDREHAGVRQAQAGDEVADREERDAERDGHGGDQLGRRVDLALQRRRLVDDGLRQRGDPPQLGVHAGAVDDGLGVAAGAERAGEDEVLCLQRRRRGCGALGATRDRLRLAGQRRHVDLHSSRDQARVGRQPVALGEQQQVARDQHGRVDLDQDARAPHAGARREQVAQCLGGVFGLTLLGERERRVEHDDDDDRRGQGDDARGERQAGGHPQQQGQRVRELVQHAAPPMPSRVAPDLVGSELQQTARGLAIVQPFGLRPQVGEQAPGVLLGIELGDRDELWGRGHRKDGRSTAPGCHRATATAALRETTERIGGPCTMRHASARESLCACLPPSRPRPCAS